MRAERNWSRTGRSTPLTKVEAEVLRLWRAGVSRPLIRRRLRLRTEGRVSAIIARLRRRGHDIPARTGKRSRTGRRPFQPPPLLDKIAVAPAVLMDAEGRVLGRMDPETRKRVLV